MKKDDIPHVNNCPRTCSDCCGPVPFAESEFRALTRKERRMISMSDGITGKCCFSSPDGCMIYDKRPIMCRLFAAVDSPLLTCPRGARAERPLACEEAREMLRAGGPAAFIS